MSDNPNDCDSVTVKVCENISYHIHTRDGDTGDRWPPEAVNIILTELEKRPHQKFKRSANKIIDKLRKENILVNQKEPSEKQLSRKIYYLTKRKKNVLKEGEGMQISKYISHDSKKPVEKQDHCDKKTEKSDSKNENDSSKDDIREVKSGNCDDGSSNVFEACLCDVLDQIVHI